MSKLRLITVLWLVVYCCAGAAFGDSLIWTDESGAQKTLVLGKVIGMGGYGEIYKPASPEDTDLKEYQGWTTKVIPAEAGTRLLETSHFQQFITDLRAKKFQRALPYAPYRKATHIDRDGNKRSVYFTRSPLITPLNVFAQMLAWSNLHNETPNGRKIQIALMRHVMAEVFLATEEMRSNGYAHRDLKPENMGVFINDITMQSRIVFFDFDTVKLISTGDDTKREEDGRILRQGMTLGFASPERWNGNISDIAYTDYYSAGISLYNLFFPEHPYEFGTIPGYNRNKVIEIMETELTDLKKLPDLSNEEILDVENMLEAIQATLDFIPEQRLKVLSLLKLDNNALSKDDAAVVKRTWIEYLKSILGCFRLNRQNNLRPQN